MSFFVFLSLEIGSRRDKVDKEVKGMEDTRKAEDTQSFSEVSDNMSSFCHGG